MIIEKIHIDAFGKLRDFTLIPKDGLNCVFGNNEDGKTTVMSFIRLMFYGDCGKKTDIGANLRRRFTPLTGEKMGGSIDFSHDGGSYTLIKQFAKTVRSDRVMLLDRVKGTEITLPSGEEIGETLFGLGADAFERSFYIGSLPLLGDGGYNELSSKLAAAIYTGDRSDGFGEIDERLESAVSTFRTPRKAGISDKLERGISLLHEALTEATDRERLRLSLEKDKADLAEKIKATEKELSRALSSEKLSLLKRESDNRKRLAVLKSAAVSEEALDRAEKLLDELKSTEAELTVLSPKAAEEKPSEEGFSEMELAEANAATKAAEKLWQEKQFLVASLQKEGAKKAGISVSIILFVLAVAAAVGAAFLKDILLFALLGASVFFIALGALIWVLQNKKARLYFNEKLNRAISEEDAASQELSALRSHVAVLTERKRQSDLAAERLALEKGELSARLRQKENRLLEIKGELRGILGEGDYGALLRTARERAAEEHSLSSVLSQSAFKDMSDGELSALLASAVEDYRGDNSATVSARLESEKNEFIRRESELKTAFSRDKNPAVIEREIKEKEAVLSAQNSHVEALSLAREVLTDAYYEMRRSFAPELNRLTAQYFSSLTNGKYTDTTVSDEFSVLIKGDGSLPMQSEYLSAGGRDQLDLALRLALSTLIGKEGRLPLLLDDVLIQYDEGRAERAFSLIREYAKERQVIFFTCHRHIKELAAKNGAENLTL